MKRELKLENKALKDFYIRIQTDIPYNKKDSFNNYEVIHMLKDLFILILMNLVI